MRLSSLMSDYAKNPVNNFEMDDFTVKQEEDNGVCGDDITVYLKIEGNNLLEYSFAGNPSTITTAAASILAEEICDYDLDKIITLDYNYMLEMDFEVSPRRRRAAVLPLLAVRNAIHKYRNDDIRDTLEDLIDF